MNSIEIDAIQKNLETSYGKRLMKLTISVGSDYRVAFFRKPDRYEFGAIAYNLFSNPIDSFDTFINSCLIKKHDGEAVSDIDFENLEQYATAFNLYQEMISITPAGFHKDGQYYVFQKDNFSCKLRKPNLAEWKEFVVAEINDPISAKEQLLEKLWVDGDQLIQEDDELFLAFAASLNKVIEIYTAELSKK